VVCLYSTIKMTHGPINIRNWSLSTQKVRKINTNMEFKKDVHEEAITHSDLGEGRVQSWALVSVVNFCCTIQSNSTNIDYKLCVLSVKLTVAVTEFTQNY